jgi:hypothetical protein
MPLYRTLQAGCRILRPIFLEGYALRGSGTGRRTPRRKRHRVRFHCERRPAARKKGGQCNPGWSSSTERSLAESDGGTRTSLHLGLEPELPTRACQTSNANQNAFILNGSRYLTNSGDLALGDQCCLNGHAEPCATSIRADIEPVQFAGNGSVNHPLRRETLHHGQDFWRGPSGVVDRNKIGLRRRV